MLGHRKELKNRVPGHRKDLKNKMPGRKKELNSRMLGREKDQENKNAAPPKPVRRSQNKHSSLKSGRTIGEKRERLETANERLLAREKDKKKAKRRVLLTILGFLFGFGLFLMVGYYLFFYSEPDSSLAEKGSFEGSSKDSTSDASNQALVIDYTPSVEVVDENTGQAAALTSRMKEYIGQAEVGFRELGFQVSRVVLPVGSVREMDFYLEGVPGFLKLVLDRGVGVSVEDADRMLRYLKNQGINEFSYIDVRLDGRAYWK